MVFAEFCGIREKVRKYVCIAILLFLTIACSIIVYGIATRFGPYCCNIQLQYFFLDRFL